jgi:iron complex transport system permease protein
MAVGWAVLLVRAKALNTLGLGDAVAASSGVAVGRLRIEVFAAASLMTAATVALVGPIGFVGLIIPHITRMLLGPDHRRNVIAAALLGAGFLLGAEALCRAAGPALNVGKVPVGILCALCGGPFFILLLRRRGRETRV